MLFHFRCLLRVESALQIIRQQFANCFAVHCTLPGAGHVPYVQFRDQILTQTTNFLWWEMDLQHASH